MGNVYEGLVRIDQDSTIQPLLATSWELDDAGTTYTFHLREGVKSSSPRIPPSFPSTGWRTGAMG